MPSRRPPASPTCDLDTVGLGVDLAKQRNLGLMSLVTFHREKFRELLLYIASQTADDPWFGDTHLNKVLYWTDFLGYSDLGQPVTGAPYFKLQFGPAAKPLLPVRDELLEEGLVSVDEPPSGSKKARKTYPKRDPDTSLFDPKELELADGVIRLLKDHTAKRVSDMSHEESAGWNLVGMYEDIPYRTALISTEQPAASTLARARERADHLGW